MDSELYSLYLSFSEPANQSRVNEISAAILTLYSNPNSFNQILSILSDKQTINSSIRLYAAVGLHKVISLHCEEILSDEQGFALLGQVLRILSEEDDIKITRNIVFALTPIFNQTGDSWNDLNMLIDNLLKFQDVNKLITVIEILSEYLKYVSSEFLLEILPNIFPIIERALDSNNIDLVIAGFKLFAGIQNSNANLIKYAGLFIQSFQKMVKLFVNMLIKENNNSHDAANYLAESINPEIPFDSPINLFNMFLQILQIQDISIYLRHLALFPLQKIVKYYGSFIRQGFNEAINVLINFSAAQFNGYGFENEEDSHFIYSIFSKIAQASNSEQIIKSIVQLANSTNEPSYSFAILSAFHGCVDVNIEQIEVDFDEIIEMIISKIQLNNISLTELSFIILEALAKGQSNAFANYAESIITILVQYYKIDNIELSRITLELFSTILDYVDLDPSFIVNYLQDLLNGYKTITSSLKHEVMNVISGIVCVCGEYSREFSDSILQIIWEGSQLTGSDDINIRNSCIQALGNLLVYAENCNEIFDSAIEMILGLTNDNDKYLKDICLKIVEKLIKYRKNKLQPDFYQLSLVIALTAIGTPFIDENDFDYEEDEDEDISATEIIIDGFGIIKQIAKFSQNSFDLQSKLTQAIIQSFKDFINLNHPDITISAIRASTTFYSIFKEVDTDIVNTLQKMILESISDDVVQASFNGYKKLLMAYHPKAIAQCNDFLLLCFKGLLRQLYFQTSSCTDEENRYNYIPSIMESIHSLICYVMKVNIQNFPVQQYFEVIISLIPNIFEQETNALLGTLGDLVSAGGKVNDEFVQLCLSKLQNCNFSLSPDPIYFFRSLICKQPELVQQYIVQFVNFSISILNTEVNTGTYYWATIANVCAALLSLLTSPSLGGLININDFIGLIINKLPVKGDYEEGSFIYYTLLTLYQRNQNEMNNYLEPLYIGIIKTLALKDKTFNKYHFTQEIYSSLVNFINNIPEWKNKIPEILLNDQFKIAKLQERLL